MPVAIRELTEVYDLKCAFLVTDANLFGAGIVRPVEEALKKGGMRIAEYFCEEGGATFAAAEKGLPKMLEFEPDAIIGVGGGSVMNLAKAMWILYEHPDLRLEDLAARFDRTTSKGFPELGQKAKLFLLSTTAGTGAECSPFAVLKEDGGEKRVIASFDLLPEIAVIDSDFSQDAPVELVKRSGLTVLAQAVRAALNPGATQYIIGFARDAVRDVFENLPKAVREPIDRKARENMANAAALAGMAYSNAASTLEPNAGYYPSEAEKTADRETLAKLADLARHTGLSNGEDEEAARALIAKCEEMQAL